MQNASVKLTNFVTVHPRFVQCFFQRLHYRFSQGKVKGSAVTSWDSWMSLLIQYLFRYFSVDHRLTLPSPLWAVHLFNTLRSCLKVTGRRCCVNISTQSIFLWCTEGPWLTLMETLAAEPWWEHREDGGAACECCDVFVKPRSHMHRDSGLIQFTWRTRTCGDKCQDYSTQIYPRVWREQTTAQSEGVGLLMT